MKLAIVLLLTACGAPQEVSNVPATATRTPTRSTGAVTQTATPSTATVEPIEPPADGNAPPTSPRAYNAEQCKQRVALFSRRTMAAYEHSARAHSVARRAVFSDMLDTDLTPPLMSLWVVGSRDRMAAELCGAWGVEVVSEDKTKLVIDGKQRNAKVITAVTKRLPTNGSIGLHLEPHTSLEDVVPLLTELSKLGPLSLSVAVEGGAPYAIPTQDAPAWALERFRAIQQQESFAKLISAGISDSASGCAAHKVANDKVLSNDASDKGLMIAKEYTKAVTACSCKDMDVDALELFTMISLAYDRRSISEGWLELRLDLNSATVVQATTGQDLARKISKLPREQRRSGIKIEAATGGRQTLGGRCKGEL